MDIDVIHRDVTRLKRYLPTIEKLHALFGENGDAPASGMEVPDKVAAALADLQAAKATYESMTAEMQAFLASAGAPVAVPSPEPTPPEAPAPATDAVAIDPAATAS